MNLKEFITVFFPIFLSSGVLESKQIHAGSDKLLNISQSVSQL